MLALQNIAIFLFGLNPLVWLLHIRLLDTRELRCDEEAIAQTGISSVEYSKLLYGFLASKHLVHGTCFAQNRRSILRRFRHILSLDQQRGGRHRRLYAVAPVMFLLLMLPFSCIFRTAPFAPEKLPAASWHEPAGESIFIAYDSAPEPVGGFAAIQRKLDYPESARKAGIQGRVILNVLIAEDGSVEDVSILKSLKNQQIDEASIAAVRAVKWRPAMQEDHPVKVWVGIPILFRLKEN